MHDSISLAWQKLGGAESTEAPKSPPTYTFETRLQENFRKPPRININNSNSQGFDEKQELLCRPYRPLDFLLKLFRGLRPLQRICQPFELKRLNLKPPAV